jgi:hypothetical protein
VHALRDAVLDDTDKGEVHVTRSIAFAALLVVAVSGCVETPVQPSPPPVAFVPAPFVPYCGQIWKVAGQGYIDIPCPPGINYAGAR